MSIENRTSTISRLRWQLAQYLERRWWQRYLRGKSPADYLRDKRAYWLRTLDNLDWEPVPGRRVLDAGCGPAGVFIALAGTEEVTALDPLLDHYERDLAIFHRANYPGVRFVTAPLEEAEPAGPYAAIYSFNAINHVRDWDRALDVLTRQAATGTRLLLTSDVHRHAWLRPVFAALPGDVLHPQQHGPEAYRRALTERGWRIEREDVLRTAAIFNYVAWTATYHG